MEAPQPTFTRPYRSKRNRPCDVCRSRKVYCRIEETPPCQLCRKLDVACTFVEGPAKRQQTNAQTELSVLADHQGMTYPPNALHSFQASQISGFQLESGSSSRNVLQSSRETQISTHQEVDATNPNPDSSFAFDMMDFGSTSYNDFGLVLDDNVNLNDVLRSPTIDMENGNGNSPQIQHAVIPETSVPLEEYPIDGKEGVHGLYFGLSGETDPYLLRHYRYDNHGEFRMWKLVFRQTANDLYNDIPSDEANNRSPDANLLEIEELSNGHGTTQPPVPVHFMMAADELADEAKLDTTIRPHMSSQGIRMELDSMIRPEDGSRLIGLFFNYIFPALPVVSRYQMGITSNSPFPSIASIAKVPTHLLAAIYALSLPFHAFDDHLCVSNAYKKPPARDLWRLVFEEILREIHTPRLSVLQASLLYLQRPRESCNSATADTPFRWSFMASTFGLATSLGVHVDCQDWRIPAWEKRLRRRLWWVTYSEEKWRSLLQGQPALINKDQWDVAELNDTDFVIDGVESPTNGNGSTSKMMVSEDKAGALHFRHLANLAQIVDDVYQSFYTLRASRTLSRDFSSSLNTAQPLRHRLRSWYTSLPSSLKMKDRASASVLDSNASLHLAYLTLEILLYRALLRPLGRSNGWSNTQDPSNPIGNLHNNNRPPNTGSEHDFEALFGGLQVAAEATVSAAEHCARLATSFTAELTSRDFSGFWYSWSRIGFATMSNFVLLLLIQAPTAEHAVESKAIADTWRQTLRFQSKSCELMNMGMLRLDAIYWSGMEKVFIAEPHVRRVL